MGDEALPAPVLACPVLHGPGDRILLAHGEGARLSRRLIRDVLLSAFDNGFLRPLGDGAVLPANLGNAVVSTDSYVVSPLFFPGGDIGKLAVYGTVNDLAVAGAEPLYLSVGLIIEEGLPLETLQRVVGSMREALAECGMAVVTGDTKVVPRGAADKLFINTTGIGRLRSGLDLGAHRVRPGDQVLVSGTIGDHGVAILAAREDLGFEAGLASDTAPLHEMVRSLYDEGVELHFLRDPTRGGVSAVLHEVAEAANAAIVIDEPSLPVSPAVRGACELLGLDPLYVANEGKLLAIVPPEASDRALACIRRHFLGTNGARIGTVACDLPSEVYVRGPLGTLRVLDEPAGALLPRIC